MAEEKNQEAVGVKKTSFFKSVKADFKKIIWPKRESVAKETGAVVFFGVVLGVLIAVIDAVVRFALGLIM